MNLESKKMKDRLYHHGIKGQKWGVRRYQNPDGSLTEAGKERYYLGTKHFKVVDDYARYVEEHGNKRYGGQKWINEPSKKQIPKGTELYRISTVPIETLDRRMYVTSSKEDATNYADLGLSGEGMPSLRNAENYYIHTLTASKNLKVATGKEVTEYITNKYGNKSMKQAMDLNNRFDLGINTLQFEYEYKRSYAKNRDPKKEYMGQYLTDRFNKYKHFIRKQMLDEKTSSDIFKEFAKRGYDAITDPEDAANDSFLDSIIVIDPKSRVDKKEVSRIVDIGYDAAHNLELITEKEK